MSQEGDQGVSQSGFTLQDAGTTSPRNSKRCRDESEEEERHPTGLGMESERVKTMDLNLASDGARQDQGSLLSDLTDFKSEKRIKCGPLNLENDLQTPISSSATANKDVIVLDGGDNTDFGITSKTVIQEGATAMVKVSGKVAEGGTQCGNEGGTQFQCDLCSVKSTSAKDLHTHLAGKRHARALELASRVGTPSIVKSPPGGSKSGIHTPLKVQASTEHSCADGSGEASKGLNPSMTNGKEVNVWSSSSKCPDLNDANTVAMEPHSSMDCSFREVLAKNSPRKICCDDSHNKSFVNGTVHNPTIITDGFLEKICGQVVSEEDPYKCLAASLSAKSHSDCVARALASVVSFHACPGLGHVQEVSSCEPAATACLDSQLEGAKNTDNEGMVTMHTRCFANLLHDVRIGVMEDLLRHGGLTPNSLLPSSAPISVLAPNGEDLNCSVCRVEYGSKADLDLHLAGRKHASLVQRVFSRCQLCNLNCNTERDFKTHLSGKKHASKLRLVQKRVTF